MAGISRIGKDGRLVTLKWRGAKLEVGDLLRSSIFLLRIGWRTVKVRFVFGKLLNLKKKKRN